MSEACISVHVYLFSLRYLPVFLCTYSINQVRIQTVLRNFSVSIDSAVKTLSKFITQYIASERQYHFVVPPLLRNNMAESLIRAREPTKDREMTSSMNEKKGMLFSRTGSRANTKINIAIWRFFYF